MLTAGCATLHVHPLLGPAVAGPSAWQLLNSGGTYEDPEGRFRVTAPEPMAWITTDRGVVFNAMEPIVGGTSYAVFAWPRPADPSGMRYALLASAQAMKMTFARKGIRMRVLHELQDTYNGRPSMSLRAVLTDKWDRTPPNIAMIRLVEQGPWVYWVCTAHPTLGEPEVTPEHAQRAGQFLESITFNPQPAPPNAGAATSP